MATFNMSGLQTLRMIGSGAFGAVYLVKDPSNDTSYALKLVKCAWTNDQQREYLRREIEIMHRAVHPAVLRLVAFMEPSETDPSARLVLEYMHNGSLFEMLERTRKGEIVDMWNVTIRTKVVFGIAAGMRYLHSLDIVHRDLKSENILLSEFFEPKICDFGLSKMMSNDNLKNNTQKLGTPLYMAPELFQNAPYDGRVDVYAFGMIMFEVVTGVSPFADIVNPMALGMKIVNGERPEIPEGTPEIYSQLIERCWSQDPDDRPSFGAVVEQLLDEEAMLPDTDVAIFNAYKKVVCPELTPVAEKREVTYETMLMLQNYFTVRMDELNCVVAAHGERIGALLATNAEQSERIEMLMKINAERSQEATEAKGQVHMLMSEMESVKTTVAECQRENKELRDMWLRDREWAIATEQQLVELKKQSQELRKMSDIEDQLAEHTSILDKYKTNFVNTGEHLKSLHRQADNMQKILRGTKCELQRDARDQNGLGPLDNDGMRSAEGSPERRSQTLLDGDDDSSAVAADVDSDSLLNAVVYGTPGICIEKDDTSDTAASVASSASDTVSMSLNDVSFARSPVSRDIGEGSACAPSSAPVYSCNAMAEPAPRSFVADSLVYDIVSVPYDENPLNGICAKLGRDIGGGGLCVSGIIGISGHSESEEHNRLIVNVVEYTWDSYWKSAAFDGSSLVLDFFLRKVIVNAYSLKTHAPGGISFHLRSWYLEGSNDLTEWVELDRVSNDDQLSNTKRVASFACKADVSIPFRFLRLRQDGPSSGGSGLGFALTSLELFGGLMSFKT